MGWYMVFTIAKKEIELNLKYIKTVQCADGVIYGVYSTLPPMEVIRPNQPHSAPSYVFPSLWSWLSSIHEIFIHSICPHIVKCPNQPQRGPGWARYICHMLEPRSLWHYLALLSGSFWPAFWLSLAHYCPCLWQSLALYGPLWLSLSHLGSLWLSSAHKGLARLAKL